MAEGCPPIRLFARGYTRVARKLADRDGATTVSPVQLAEAISYHTLIDEVRRPRWREMKIV